MAKIIHGHDYFQAKSDFSVATIVIMLKNRLRTQRAIKNAHLTVRFRWPRHVYFVHLSPRRLLLFFARLSFSRKWNLGKNVKNTS